MKKLKKLMKAEAISAKMNVEIEGKKSFQGMRNIADGKEKSVNPKAES